MYSKKMLTNIILKAIHLNDYWGSYFHLMEILDYFWFFAPMFGIYNDWGIQSRSLNTLSIKVDFNLFGEGNKETKFPD